MTGIIGAGLAPRLAARHGLGSVVTAAAWLAPAAYALLLLAAPGPLALVWPVVAHLVFRSGLRHQGTPRHELPQHDHARPAPRPDERDDPVAQLGLDRRLGTLGGWVAATWGNRVAIAVGIAGLAGAATLLTLSPYRRAEFPTDAPER